MLSEQSAEVLTISDMMSDDPKYVVGLSDIALNSASKDDRPSLNSAPEITPVKNIFLLFFSGT